MVMEAQWLVEDPVYGCDGIINQLQEEISAHAERARQDVGAARDRPRAQCAAAGYHGCSSAAAAARDDGHRVPDAQM